MNTNQTNLISARLFEKGVKDAMSGLNPVVTFSRLEGGKSVLIRAEFRPAHMPGVYKSEFKILNCELEITTGHYSMGKRTGFRLAQAILEAICHDQPQEISLSLKDIDKAREADRKNNLTMPYGSPGEHFAYF